MNLNLKPFIITLFLGATLIAGLWIAQIWLDLFSPAVFAQTSATLVILCGFISLLVAISFDLKAHKTPWLLYIFAALGFVALALLVTDIWFAGAIPPDILSKSMFSLIVMGGLNALALTLSDGWGREKQLKDEDYLD